MNIIRSIVILSFAILSGACTDYTSTEEKARAARVKDSIVVAEKQAIEAERLRQEALEASIMTMQDSIGILPGSESETESATQ